jgi:hypothetical protein
VDETTQVSAGTSTQTAQTVQEEMVPKSQVERIVSARVNETNKRYADYDTYKSGHEKYKGALSKMAKIAGLDSEEALLAQLDLAESRGTLSTAPTGTTTPVRQVMDPELKKEIETARNETRDTRFDLEENRLTADPTYADLKQPEVKQAVRDYATKNGTNMQTAFWVMYGPTVAKKQVDATEQRVRASLQEQLARGGVITEMTPEIKALGLEPDEIAGAQHMGMTPEFYAGLKNAKTIDDYRALKAKFVKK